MKLLNSTAIILPVLFTSLLFSGVCYCQNNYASNAAIKVEKHALVKQKVHMYWLPPVCLTNQYTWMSDSIASFIEEEIAAKEYFDIDKNRLEQADSFAVVKMYIDSALSSVLSSRKGFATTGRLLVSGKRNMVKRCACYQGADTTLKVTSDTNTSITIKMRFCFDVINLKTCAREAGKTFTGKATGSNINKAAGEAYNKMWLQILQESSWIQPLPNERE